MNETDTAMNQESSNKFEAGKAHAKQAAEEMQKRAVTEWQNQGLPA